MSKIDIDSLEQVLLKDLSYEERLTLLKELGFDTDGIYILKEGKKINDRYIDIPVKISNMVIVPGSTIILDDNELSISMYLQEYCLNG